MKIGTATHAKHDGLGFYVSISAVGIHVSTSNLGTIIGWARIAQRRQGLTCFAISNSLTGLYFEPANPASLEELQKDLIVILEAIGFETGELAFTEETTPHLRRHTHQPAEVAAIEQPLNA